MQPMRRRSLPEGLPHRRDLHFAGGGGVGPSQPVRRLQYCIEACPYKVRTLDHHEGISVKCWFCIDLVRQGGEPACVTTCPTQVRIFGDLDDPNSRISRFIARAPG